MKKLLFLYLILIFYSLQLQSQTNRNDDCNKIINQVEKLLLYKDKSPSQLRSLMSELKACLGEENQIYKQLNIRVKGNLLPIDIKLVKSDIYNKRYREGVRKIPQLKLHYPYSDEITKLEKYVDKRIFSNYKKEVLRKKPSHISIEPSFSLSTVEERIDGFDEINTTVIHPVYGISVSAKFNQKSKFESSTKPTRFSYSQIGFKIEYRDAQTFLFSDISSPNSYYGNFTNFQLSLLLRKCLGFDFGYLKYQNNTLVNRYTGALNFYIPIRFISIGASAKLISDFRDNHDVQFSLGTKLNLGLFKIFSKGDREEINTKILLLKD